MLLTAPDGPADDRPPCKRQVSGSIPLTRSLEVFTFREAYFTFGYDTRARVVACPCYVRSVSAWLLLVCAGRLAGVLRPWPEFGHLAPLTEIVTL